MATPMDPTGPLAIQLLQFGWQIQLERAGGLELGKLQIPIARRGRLRLLLKELEKEGVVGDDVLQRRFGLVDALLDGGEGEGGEGSDAVRQGVHLLAQ